MRLLFSLSAIFLLLSFSVNDKEKIQWDSERQLSWSDFRGTPSGSGSYVASTNSGISFSYSIGKRNGEMEFKYTVKSNFYPQQSWYLPEAASAYILKHEQTHFDISELHARILRKRLEEVEVTDDIKARVDYMYGEIERDRRAMQSEFDKQSDHSKIREAEFQWRDFVAKELQRYEQWQ